ncbi:MAG: ATP-binding protein [Paenisporosarcina sp.]
MENLFLLRKRNRLFLHIFSVGLLVHSLFSIFISNEFSTRIHLIALAYCTILFILQKLHVNEKVFGLLLLFGLNGYIVNINLGTPDYIHLLLFIYPLFIASLYHSVVPNLIVLPITLGEIIYLFSHSFASYVISIKFSDLYVLVSLILLVGFTAIIHSIFIQKTWKWVEEQHSSMERALLSKEGYLQLFFENAKDGIAVFDLDSRIIEVNPAFEKLYGWSKDESIGNQIPLVPPENTEDAKKRLIRILEGETFRLLETKEMRKNGTFFDGQLTLSPIFDRKDELVAMSVISRDVSYKKEAEKLLVQSEKLKLAGEIAAGVAHEIRNPMTVISGFIQMMNQDDRHPYQGYTNLILMELERINLIISEFLVLAKPHVTTTKEFSIEKTIQDVAMLFKPELNLRGIELIEEWNFSDIDMTGEQNQIKQVFINIIKNAIEVLDQGGKLQITADMETEKMVAIRFKDNGSGMTPEVVDQIFEPFFTTKQSGTGLGMMISEKIIKEHGGSIHIKSKVGFGTEVSILLPYRERKTSSSD